VDIRVERRSFFRNPDGGTLRFVETSPEQDRCEKQICNCTKDVVERPLGDPFEVRQDVTLHGEMEGRGFVQGQCSFEFNLSDPGVTYRWGADHHAYFSFGGDMEMGASANEYHRTIGAPMKRLRMEIARPGYGLTGYFFGHLFFGNEINIDVLANNSYRSKLVNLDKIPKDAIWAYESSWGGEAMEILSPEAKGELQIVRKNVDHIHARAHLVSPTYSVNGDHALIQSDGTLITCYAPEVIRVTSMILFDMRDSELFRACDRVWFRAREEEKKLHASRED